MAKDHTKIPLRHRRCHECGKTMIDICRNPETGRWQRTPDRAFCSRKCFKEARKPGGVTWMRKHASEGALEASGLG